MRLTTVCLVAMAGLGMMESCKTNTTNSAAQPTPEVASEAVSPDKPGDVASLTVGTDSSPSGPNGIYECATPQGIVSPNQTFTWHGILRAGDDVDRFINTIPELAGKMKVGALHLNPDNGKFLCQLNGFNAMTAMAGGSFKTPRDNNIYKWEFSSRTLKQFNAATDNRTIHDITCKGRLDNKCTQNRDWIFKKPVTVSGVINGLGNATGLALSNPPTAQAVPVAAAATSFSMTLVTGQALNLTVGTQPQGLVCSITNGVVPSVTSNITNVKVNCAKACQTSADIRAHIAIVTTSPLVINGVAVPDINSRFCVNTVLDGTKRLVDGAALDPAVQVLNGLMVAVSDVKFENNAATFEDAQKACAALTSLGQPAGYWKVPMSTNTNAGPRETVANRSAESVGAYLHDPIFFNNPVYGSGMWWTSSVVTNNPAPMSYAWQTEANAGAGGIVAFFRGPQFRYGVRCIGLP